MSTFISPHSSHPTRNPTRHPFFHRTTHLSNSRKVRTTAPLVVAKFRFFNSGQLPDPENVKELFGKVEGILYTLADAAVNNTDVVETSSTVSKQNGDWLSGITSSMESILKVFKNGLSSVHVPYSYGFAIILLTVLVKAATFPLSKKQGSTLTKFASVHPGDYVVHHEGFVGLLYLKFIRAKFNLITFQEVLRELELDWACSSPNMISCYGVRLHNGEAISMLVDYATKGSLQDIISWRGRLHEFDIASIVTQLLRCLVSLHDRCFVTYADITPSSILLLDDGIIKLSGFGIIGMISNSLLVHDDLDDLRPGFEDFDIVDPVLDHKLLNKIIYMSPERLSGGCYDFSSHLWGLGILALECGGCNPFGGAGSYEERRFWSYTSTMHHVPPVSSFLESFVTVTLLAEGCKKERDTPAASGLFLLIF